MTATGAQGVAAEPRCFGCRRGRRRGHRTGSRLCRPTRGGERWRSTRSSFVCPVFSVVPTDPGLDMFLRSVIAGGQPVEDLSREELESHFDKHGGDIFGWFQRRAGGAVAEDLVSEVFIEAFRSRGAFRRSLGGTRQWFFGIARNVHRQHLKGLSRSARLVPLALDVLDHTDHRDHEQPFESVLVDGLDNASMLDRHRRLLDRLSHVDRRMLELRFGDEMSYPSIAAAVGKPEGTVKSRIHRNTRKLRAWANDPNEGKDQ